MKKEELKQTLKEDLLKQFKDKKYDMYSVKNYVSKWFAEKGYEHITTSDVKQTIYINYGYYKNNIFYNNYFMSFDVKKKKKSEEYKMYYGTIINWVIVDFVFEMWNDEKTLEETINELKTIYQKDVEKHNNQVKEAQEIMNYLKEKYSSKSETELYNLIGCLWKDRVKLYHKDVAKYEKIKELVIAIGSTTEDIETQNKLVEQLESLLPFRNDIEKSKWIDLTTTFKFWEDWEEKTMKIAERLLN